MTDRDRTLTDADVEAIARADEVRRALGLPRKRTSRSPRVRLQQKAEAATLPLFDGGER